jgi:hypothetical protein
MPGGKRIKTPPPPEDEPRYLTVVHPYPLNANLELHADRRTLALWLACCTGKDVLFAMFYKPSVSPSKIFFKSPTDTTYAHKVSRNGHHRSRSRLRQIRRSAWIAHLVQVPIAAEQGTDGQVIKGILLHV